MARFYSFSFICIYCHEFFRVLIYLLFIEMNKFSKHNRMHILFYVMKYFDIVCTGFLIYIFNFFI